MLKISEDIAKIFKSVLPMTSHNYTVFKKHFRIRKHTNRISDNEVANVVYNSLSSLGKGTEDYANKHKLHAAIIALEEVTDQLLPLSDNLYDNKVSLKKLKHELEEKKKLMMDQIAMINRSISRIQNLNSDSSIHADKNPMTRKLLDKKEKSRYELTNAVHLLSTVLSGARETDNEEVAAFITLRSSVETETKDVKEGLRELMYLMKKYLGLYIKDKTKAFLNQSKW